MLWGGECSALLHGPQNYQVSDPKEPQKMLSDFPTVPQEDRNA